MNLIGTIITVAVLFDFFVHGLADFLNIRILREDLPKAFCGVYNKRKYKKSQEYLRAVTKFQFITSSFHILVFFCFWFGKGFPFIDQYFRSWNFGPIITGLFFIGSLLICSAFLHLPFQLFSTFVIEEHFGFNNTNWKTFLMDMVKYFFLTIVLGLPLLSSILFLFEYAGTNAWWLAWISATFFLLAVQYIAPTWIMPLFNKFIILEEGELKNAIMSYAHSIKFPLDNVMVMDGSRRSDKSNAFFTGFGKNKRIVLYDTLIKQNTTKQLLAVIAHEMGHYKKKHILQMTAISIAQSGIVFFILSICITNPNLFNAFFMEHLSVYAGLIFFVFLYSPATFFMDILFNIISRRNEYKADEFAVKTTVNPEALADALKKISMNNFANLTPHPLYVFLNYSHPPILERIRHILK